MLYVALVSVSKYIKWSKLMPTDLKLSPTSK